LILLSPLVAHCATYDSVPRQTENNIEVYDDAAIDGAAGSGGSVGTSHRADGGSGTSLINVSDAALLNLDKDVVETPGIYMLPSDFTAGTMGGFKLGEPFSQNAPVQMEGGVNAGGCGGAILGVSRDFKVARENNGTRKPIPGGHPDFEWFEGAMITGLAGGEQGIIKPDLDADLKPVYADGPHKLTTSKVAFDQWFRNVDGVNQAFFVYLVVQPNGTVFTFDSNKYFPLDGKGWGGEGYDHNFGFTSEFHTSFQYNGGETFTFRGDDDVWVFINRKLAIDLGGLHEALEKQIQLDQQASALGLTKGQVYSFDLFHAERHSTESNFRIDTNLQFVNCGVIAPIN
jgi:fibro-slime domain-containing protein